MENFSNNEYSEINIVLRELELLERDYLVKKNEISSQESQRLLEKIQSLEEKLDNLSSN